jgi:hypothetical protein
MNRSQPLWMPRGSVRAILALVFAVGFIVAVFNLPPEQVAVLSGMTGLVVKDYFSTRASEPPNGG